MELGSFSSSFSEEELVIRAILWDNDGVLVDTEGLYFSGAGGHGNTGC